VGELAGLLAAWRVREVQAHPPHDVLLVLEPVRAVEGAPPGIRRLRLSAHPDAARVHLQLGRLARHDGPSGPFFQRLATELPGAEIVRIEQVGGDRLVLLELRGGACGERRALLLELTGRHANLLLLGPEDRLVDWLVPAPAGRASARLALGSVWKPPGGSARAPGEAGPSIAEALPAPDETAPGADGGRAPLSWRVERALGALADEARASELAARLRARLARKIERTRALVAGLEERARACADVERVRQDGELLKTHLARLRRGMDHVEVADWFAPDGSPRRIALDPKKSPQENLERLFERAKKLERSRESVAEEIELARARLRSLQSLRGRLEGAGADPEALEREAVEQGLLEAPQEADVRRRPDALPRLPYRVFLASRGSEVRVGRSASDNDELTLRHSRGSDLWLHTADAPGSHVVLRLAKGAAADEEEVLDAAHLAVHFSPLREARRALVHVALRKLVHKPRGAKAGLVSLSGGRTIDLRVQQDRIERLLRSARRGVEGPPG
jgi:predicted ribosome quality control (RQC) complex YloA/Tae2 family protein